jgi:hypothetical protein
MPGLLNSIVQCGTVLTPFPKLEQQKEEEEHADSIWKKSRLQELKKRFASSTKMDFMKLRNDLSESGLD